MKIHITGLLGYYIMPSPSEGGSTYFKNTDPHAIAQKTIFIILLFSFCRFCEYFYIAKQSEIKCVH
jgi:hypothetical protein